MAEKTSAHGTTIEWTWRPGTKGEVWPVATGCTEVSPGCALCYAKRNAATRLKHVPRHAGLATIENGVARWTGVVRENRDLLLRPLHWRKPRTVFVAPSGDLFHEGISDDFLVGVFGAMAAARDHTFLVLTKRAKRAWQFLGAENLCEVLARAAGIACEKAGVRDPRKDEPITFPLPNVWLGTSVSVQKDAETSLAWLSMARAAVRFVSAEPLLEHVSLRDVKINPQGQRVDFLNGFSPMDWVIVGGESDKSGRQREMPMAGLEAILQDCADAGVPCFVKQDSGRRPGQQGGIPDRLWARKEWPR